ncbi:MAG: HlyD family efflux transporter periplasmic adaptor subunit [Bacteroidota bacterium]
MNLRRSITLILTVGLLLVMIVSCSSKKEEARTEETKLVFTETFNTVSVEPSKVQSSINITGRVIPSQKLEVVAQVQGLARPTRRAFKEGVDFKAGEVLIRIDDDEFRNNLVAQKSQFLSSLVRVMSDLKIDYPAEFPIWNQYLENLSIEQELLPLPEVDTPQLKYFLSANNIFNLYYSIQSAEENLSKYEVKAPFDGTVVVSQFDIGSLIRPGATLGEFIRTDRYEILASISVADMGSVQIGQVIPFTSPDTGGQWQAKIARIGKRLDPSSQSLALYLSVQGVDLKEGMYLEGKVRTSEFDNAVELSKDLITRNNQVYLIKDSIVQLKDVELLAYNATSVVVGGLSHGDKVITDPVRSAIQGIKATAR